MMTFVLTCVAVSLTSAVTYAGTCGFGLTLPSTGTARVVSEKKSGYSDYIVVSVSNTSNDNAYGFYGVTMPEEITCTGFKSTYGTGWKQEAYRGGNGGEPYVGSLIRLKMKTGSTVFTPMWIEGKFTP